MIGTIIAGAIIGALAKFFMPGKDPGGIIITILLGIAGSFLGERIGRGLGFYSEGEPAGWIMSIIGAMLLLAIYRMIKGRTAPA